MAWEEVFDRHKTQIMWTKREREREIVRHSTAVVIGQTGELAVHHTSGGSSGIDSKTSQVTELQRIVTHSTLVVVGQAREVAVSYATQQKKLPLTCCFDCK